MSDLGAEYGSTPMNPGRRQLVITAQLYRDSENMSHMDELILWLANRITTSFPIQIAQFWALRSNHARQTSVELRACVSQDPNFPAQLVINNQVATTAHHFLTGQYGTMLRPMQNLFSTYQASTLARFGLYYCSCSFMRSESLLLPAYSAQNAQLIPIPLAIAILLYMRQPPAHDALAAIDLILDQAVSIAENRFLRPPGSTTSGRLPVITSTPLQQPTSQSLYELILQRNEDDKLLTASNPLSGTSIIRDKKARRLYDAINGTRNLKEICEYLHIDLQEAAGAIRILASQSRILLYEPGGQPVDSSIVIDAFEQP